MKIKIAMDLNKQSNKNLSNYQAKAFLSIFYTSETGVLQSCIGRTFHSPCNTVAATITIVAQKTAAT